MLLAGNGLEQSQDAYMRSLNVQMTLAVAARRQLSVEEAGRVRDDLIEGLLSASRHEDAADLMDAAADFNIVLDCYVKGNAFWKAVKLCMQQNQLACIEAQVKPALLVACDLKSNQIR